MYTSTGDYYITYPSQSSGGGVIRGGGFTRSTLGMSDTVWYNGERYITRTFDCQLQVYHIVEGYLYKSEGEYRKLPPENSDKYVVGFFNYVEVRRVFQPYHGIIQMYKASDTLYAKFDTGKLVDMMNPTAYIRWLNSSPCDGKAPKIIEITNG